MSSNKPDNPVRMQVEVLTSIRRRLKIAAADLDLDMSTLAGVILDHGLTLLSSGKPPKQLADAVAMAQDAAAGRDGDADRHPA